MASRTLAELVARAKERAAMENHSGVSTAEWKRYVNDACADLYHKLIKQWSYDRFQAEKSYTIVNNVACELVSGSQTPIDPSSWLAHLSTHLSYPNGSSLAIAPFSQVDRDYKYWGGYTFQRDPIRFRVVMSSQSSPTSSCIEFEPSGKANGMTGTLRYVPDYVDLVNDSESFNGRISGWDAIVAVEAGIKARRKLRLETSDLDAERLELLSDLDKMGFLFNRAGPLKTPRRARW